MAATTWSAFAALAVSRVFSAFWDRPILPTKTLLLAAADAQMGRWQGW